MNNCLLSTKMFSFVMVLKLFSCLLLTRTLLMLKKVKSSGLIQMIMKHFVNKKVIVGVPIVAQWLRNPTRNHEVVGSAPALAQWVNDTALS